MLRRSKLAVICMCMILAVSLVGCGSKKEMVFHVSGQDLTYEETLVFGFIYAMEYNLNDEASLEDIYEGSVSYGEYYKQQLKDEIVNTMLLWNEAQRKGMKLSSDEKDSVDRNCTELESYFGKECLESYNIEKSDVQAVYNMKGMAEKYRNSITEVKSDETDVERYVKVFQVTFPTAKLDSEGHYVMDPEGNIEMLDASSAASKREEAIEFSNRAKEGENIETLLKEYDKSVTGVEKYLRYKDLSEEYKNAVDGLSLNQVSSPITFNYGYYVVKMLEQEGSGYAQALSNHEEATRENVIVEEEIQRLYDSEIGNSTDYVEDKWETIQIRNFIK